MALSTITILKCGGGDGGEDDTIFEIENTGEFLMAVSLSSKNLWSRQSNIPVGESEAWVIDSIFLRDVWMDEICYSLFCL